MNVENFIINNDAFIKNIFKYKGIDLPDFNLFKKTLSKYLESFQDLDDTLKMYHVNKYIDSNFQSKKIDIKSYTCPCCDFFNKKTFCDVFGNYLKCITCQSNYNNSNNEIDKNLYKSFANHSLSGYRCLSCNRFLPKSLAKNSEITCAYLDCIFVGNINALKKMQHPTSKDILDIKSSHPQNKKLLENNSLIEDIILEEKNQICYTNNNYNLIHKLLVYDAFLLCLKESPIEMEDYIINNSRKGGFQSKVFQKYVNLLEQSLPFVIRKNKKVITVNNLLDENLCIFDGISVFESRIDHFMIKNHTKEYYIGGRLGSYSKPYFIGKILDIIDKSNNVSLINNIESYTFNKIKMSDISDVDVIVKHLRVPPHYEMGGMVYVNRIRKNIVLKIKDNAKRY